MKNFIRSLLFFWLTAVALAACGNIPEVSNTTTGEEIDTTPPTVLSTSPTPGATGVAVNTAITATLSDASDAIDSSTVNTTTFTVADSGGNVAGTVSYDSTNNIATFTPSANLSYNTTYKATISSGVKDSAGNAMATAYTWTFRTSEEIDTTPPTVLSKSPTPNAIGVAVNTTITATLSDASNAIDSSTVNTTTFTVADSGGNVAGTVSYDSTNNIATFTPSANLSYNTDYKATISVGVKDSAGNAMASPYSWTFTTESTSISGAPGSLDTTFNSTGMVTTAIGASNGLFSAVAIQSDGKIVAAGYSNTNNGSNFDFALVRYNTDGSLDTTFNGTGKVTTDIGMSIEIEKASAIAIQSDGKIVAAGYSSNGSNNQDFALVRYNTDGNLDTTFNGTGKVTTAIGTSHDYAYAVAIQSDGRIVVAGSSSTNSDTAYVLALVRYNTDGSLDTTFNSTGKVTTAIGTFIDSLSAVAIQSDGKIVAAGSSYQGSNEDFALVRYNTDGSLDTTFKGTGKVTTAIGTSTDRAYAVAIQSDGKIVATGISYVATGISYNDSNYDFALVRYNTDGSLDTTFKGTGKVTTAIGTSTDRAYAVAIQSDGKIVATGTNNGSYYTDFAVVRYNTNGSLDTTFNRTGMVTTTASGTSYDYAYAVAIQSDGKIVAAGTSSNSYYSDFAVVRYWP